MAIGHGLRWILSIACATALLLSWAASGPFSLRSERPQASVELGAAVAAGPSLLASAAKDGATTAQDSAQPSDLVYESNSSTAAVLQLLDADDVCSLHSWLRTMSSLPIRDIERGIDQFLSAGSVGSLGLEIDRVERDKLIRRFFAGLAGKLSLAQMISLDQLKLLEPDNSVWRLFDLEIRLRQLTGGVNELASELSALAARDSWSLAWVEADRRLARKGEASLALFYLTSRLRMELFEPDLWPFLDGLAKALEPMDDRSDRDIVRIAAGLLASSVRSSVEGYPVVSGAVARFLREISQFRPGLSELAQKLEKRIAVDPMSGLVTEGDWDSALDGLDQATCSTRALVWLKRDSERRRSVLGLNGD